MGRDLYDGQPIFQEVMAQCAGWLAGELEHPLLEVLYPETGREARAERTLAQPGYGQPALLAVECALSALWRSWGVEPAYVLGDGVGEYAAAVASGALSIEEGLRLAVARGELMQELPPAPVEEKRVAEAVQTFAGVVAQVRCVSPQIAMVSSLSAPPGPVGFVPTAEYWCQRLRHELSGVSAVPPVPDPGGSALVEIGPAQRLADPEQRAPAGAGAYLPSLHRYKGDWAQLLESLGTLYTLGVDVGWTGIYAGPGRRVALPTYPFQRKRYWVEDAVPDSPVSIPEEPAPEAAPETELVGRLREVSAGEREEFLIAHIRREASAVVGVDLLDPVDTSRGFFEAGMTSLMAIELHNRLQTSLGEACALPSTVLFDYSTVEDLARYLAHAIFSAAASVPAELHAPGRADVEKILSKVENLTEEQTEAILADKLSRMGRLSTS
jgi:acyl transferase domain-containing protein